MRRQGNEAESIGSHLGRRGLKPTYSVDSLPGEVPDESKPTFNNYNEKLFNQGGSYSGIDHNMKVKLSEELAKRGGPEARTAFAHKFYDEGGEYAGIDHEMKGQLMDEWGDEPDSEPDGDVDDPILAKKKARQARLAAEKAARQGRRSVPPTDPAQAGDGDPTSTSDDPKYDIDRRIQPMPAPMPKPGSGGGRGGGATDYFDPRGEKYNPPGTRPPQGGGQVPRGDGQGPSMDPEKIKQIMQYLQMIGMR